MKYKVGDEIQVVKLIDDGPDGLIGRIGTIKKFLPAEYEEYPYYCSFVIDEDEILEYFHEEEIVRISQNKDFNSQIDKLKYSLRKKGIKI